MSELGQQLREARLQKGMSLDDVQEMTKIRKRYLEAIEAGDYKVLPGSFYVRAFIKTYAETVGLNPDELLEGHKKDVPEEETEATMEPVIQKRSSRPVERSNRWMSVALMWTFPVLIVVLLYVYVVYNNGDESDNPGLDQVKITDSQQQPEDKPDHLPTTDRHLIRLRQIQVLTVLVRATLGVMVAVQTLKDRRTVKLMAKTDGKTATDGQG